MAQKTKGRSENFRPAADLMGCGINTPDTSTQVTVAFQTGSNYLGLTLYHTAVFAVTEGQKCRLRGLFQPGKRGFCIVQNVENLVLFNGTLTSGKWGVMIVSDLVLADLIGRKYLLENLLPVFSRNDT